MMNNGDETKTNVHQQLRVGGLIQEMDGRRNRFVMSKLGHIWIW